MRKILVWLLNAALVFGAVHKNEKVQVLAKNVTHSGMTVTAEGDVLFFYKDMVLQADKVVYDTNRSVARLYGNVSLMKGFDYAMLSDYVYLDLDYDHDIFKDFFFTDHTMQVWSRGERAERDKKKLTLDKALLSSCDVTCPDWHIAYSSAEYDDETKWIDIWHPKFYIRNTPVFYLPYIGTSLNRERKSGVLRPLFGVSDRDGFVYQQSLYYAPDPQWDLEVTPQIRTDRGMGAFAQLRFVDSPDSGGYLKAGYFKTKGSYADEYNLENSSQYGFDAHYENAQIFASTAKKHHDGLYVDIHYLNDADYYNLQRGVSLIGDNDFRDSPQIRSNVNYFFTTPDNYVGVYGKYFINTWMDDDKREETFQSAPIVQLHHYQSSLFNFDFLQYSADYRFNNLFTESGRRVGMQEINVPLVFYFSFFDDLLKVSATENLYYGYASYDEMEPYMPKKGDIDDHYSVFNNYHTLNIFTDLAKPYGSQFHTMRLGLTYSKEGSSSEDGQPLKVFSFLKPPRENVLLNAVNYLYDSEGKQYLYYRIAQPVWLEAPEGEDGDYDRFADLEQEISFEFLDHYEIYSNFFISYYLSGISSASSYIKASYDQIDLKLDHLYKRVKETNEKSPDYGEAVTVSNFLRFGAIYTMESGHQLYGGVSYDNVENKMTRWNAGIHFYRHCWNIDFGVRDDIQPILASGGIPDNIHNVVFYFAINIVPFGTYGYSFGTEM